MTAVTLYDIGLKDFTLESLPRLKELRSEYFARGPEICIERARYITRYLRYHDDAADSSELRQAKKVNYFLSHKSAQFHDRNLIAGSTTSKALGAPLFPDFFALTLWPELETVSDRKKIRRNLPPRKQVSSIWKFSPSGWIKMSLRSPEVVLTILNVCNFLKT